MAVIAAGLWCVVFGWVIFEMLRHRAYVSLVIFVVCVGIQFGIGWYIGSGRILK